MHYSIHTYELRHYLSHEQKFELLKRFHDEGGYRIFKKGNETIICKFGSQGISTTIMENPCRPYIAFQISLNTLLHGEYVKLITYDEAEQAMRLAERMITDWMGEDYSCDKLTLCRVDLCVNVDVGSPENVTQYIKQLYKINMRKSYKIRGLRNTAINKTVGFTTEYEQDGTELAVYNKKHQLEDALGIPADEYKNILRIEFRLKKQSTINKYVDDTLSNTGKILSLIENGKDIIKTVLPKLLPGGDYYKLDKAIDIVYELEKDTRLRRTMEQFLRLTAEKHGLKSARAAMKSVGITDRYITRLLKSFEEIEVNPVALKKNSKQKFLPSLYRYLE